MEGAAADDGAADGDGANDCTMVEASESASPGSKRRSTRGLAPLAALERPRRALRARAPAPDARPPDDTGAGALPATGPGASAPNGGNPAKSSGLTTEAMEPGVATVPEA